jgi:hypothetical protein
MWRFLDFIGLPPNHRVMKLTMVTWDPPFEESPCRDGRRDTFESWNWWEKYRKPLVFKFQTRGRSVGKVMACSNAAAQQAATHRDQPPKE